MADRRSSRVWFFDLDNTLHKASGHVFGALNVAMTDYIAEHLDLPRDEASELRARYWHRYGATLLGLERHHGVSAAHFLAQTHALPGLEDHLHSHAHDLAALRRLPGRKFLLTNAPLAYALRVLAALGMSRDFEGVVAMEQMRMFGQLRPKPDARMFRHLLARLRLQPGQCTLVEDTLVHQKSARRVGMSTVWMQRWLQRATMGPEVGARLRRRPVYVDQRVRSLAQLKSAETACRGDPTSGSCG
ncbi:pyrimidine 5'-nucleotidase [Roseateles sp.]|uniref:pyrimidine 5'-nucleotidase n=1 Tax=Roseateles sp. TaxID=1971397 RepID=UPI003D0E859C